MNLDKYFRLRADIDLDCIYGNLQRLKANVKPGTKLAAVVKTDGYGHGAVPIAIHCADLVDFYAVATIDEASDLRFYNVSQPILIIGYSHYSRNEEAIENDIRLTAFNFDIAKRISDAAVAIDKCAKIHIKIDTGMGRIGFVPTDESIEEIIKISKLPMIEIEGIFTHFYESDGLDKTPAIKQYNIFVDFIKKLEAKGIEIAIKHCSNSAALIELPEFAMNMVRSGIATYGLWPSKDVDKDKVKLVPALSLKSHIVHLKTINAGDTVSYGATYVADHPVKVATIPIGYGDGYPRSLSNKGSVIIRGKRAPIIGRVCMDQMMVDVSNIDDVDFFDEVTLIGKDGSEEITFEELEEISGILNYELACDLSKRIPRVYYKNGRIVGTKEAFQTGDYQSWRR